MKKRITLETFQVYKILDCLNFPEEDYRTLEEVKKLLQSKLDSVIAKQHRVKEAIQDKRISFSLGMDDPDEED